MYTQKIPHDFLGEEDDVVRLSQPELEIVFRCVSIDCQRIAHFTVTGGNEARPCFDSPLLLSFVKHVVLRLISIFEQNLHLRR